MANSASISKKKQVKVLKDQVKKLQTELESVNKVNGVDEFINVKLQKARAHFERVRNPEGPDHGIGEYFSAIDITAKKADVYIPLSIASGKKATGFIYQIEGTGESSIVKTDISCSGKGISQITLGTIVYSKIPSGKTGTFRIQNEIKGKIGKTYKIVINRINYKLAPNDPRYKQYLKELNSRTLEFK
jgi:hypothetical protein